LLQYEVQNGECYYCHAPLQNKYHVDHRIPVSRGGGDGPENLACACPTCNMRKGAKTDVYFIALLEGRSPPEESIMLGGHIPRLASPPNSGGIISSGTPIQAQTTRKKNRPFCYCLTCGPDQRTWTCPVCRKQHCRHVPRQSDGTCPCTLPT
jgi:hypothetical protein